jgi:hypothetical protein
MNRKAWFGLALVLGMVGCGDIAYDSAELRGGGRNNPCATVRCAAGTHCEAHGRQAECVADDPDGGVVSSCAAVLCIVGTVCEETPSGPRCVPVPSECSSDSDCRREDNYCGGCQCLALATGESGPACSDPVQCFASPCAVTTDVAACVGGQCVLQPSAL